MHCFELRTTNVDYYVGEDVSASKQDGSCSMSSSESGFGAHLAKTWENTIRQALMPVQTTGSEYCFK